MTSNRLCFRVRSTLCLLTSALILSSSAFGAIENSKPWRIQIAGEPTSLDPARVMDQYGLGILRNVCEGLFVLDQNGNVANGLIESYTRSKDGLIYRFHLRSDAKWSDGQTVHAQEFVLGLRRALSPATASPDAQSFFSLQNAREIFAGHMPPERLGAEVENGDLLLHLSQPDPILTMKLTLPAASPTRSEFVSATGRWNTEAPSTGRYQISAYKAASQIRLAPNPYYRNPAHRDIVYSILTEEITAMNLFESGWLDIISSVTPSEISGLKQKGLVQTAPSTTVFYFSFDVSRPPFNELSYRKAVAASIDREGLARTLHGAYSPLSSYLPPQVPGAEQEPTDRFSADLERIRSQSNKPRIRLAYAQSAANQLIAEKTQNDLEQNLGLKVSLEPMELKSFLTRLRTDPPEMYLFGKSALFNDPLNHLEAFSNRPEENFSKYHSARYETLIDHLQVEPIGDKRSSLARAANQLLVEDDVVVIPALLKLQVFGVARETKGFAVNPFQVIQLGKLE